VTRQQIFPTILVVEFLAQAIITDKGWRMQLFYFFSAGINLVVAF